ncbi:MAG: hypothetical protein Q8J64_06445 [Thermodesulfovibrionales bacterium]|nr:hypothetical protein [Thermodesulfovibrionales bacterium]
MKHFNLGNVWGRVASVELKKSEGKGTPYIQIQVECPNDLHGNIKTYGRLWGQGKIDAFMDFHKKHPGSAFRFRGFFSQYDGEEGMRLSNYTFFEWAASEAKEFRATFILKGEVTGTESPRGEGKLLLHLVREGQNGHADTIEDFVVYTATAEELDGIEAGQIVEVKGVIRPKDREDYFGDTRSPIKPYLKELKILTETAEEAVTDPF